MKAAVCFGERTTETQARICIQLIPSPNQGVFVSPHSHPHVFVRTLYLSLPPS